MIKRPSFIVFIITSILVLSFPLAVYSAFKVKLPGFCSENDMKVSKGISILIPAGRAGTGDVIGQCAKYFSNLPGSAFTGSLPAVLDKRRVTGSGMDDAISCCPYGGAPAGAIPDKSIAGFVVEKPNIYIYADKDSYVSVLLENEDRILKSAPTYKKGEGWHARITNGSINSCNDFLFYEAFIPVSSCVVQNEYGFVIRAASMERDMEDMLDAYGFNDIEKRDFADYWISRMDGGYDWAFCPIARDAVELAMPLKITPAPDSIYRLWFYIVPAGTVSIKAVPDVIPIYRSSFYAVEWGGICD